jgi:hypothetical protein
MRVLTASSLTGLALLVLAGCGESVSNRLIAPSDGPMAAKSNSAPVRGLTSSAGVVPTAYDGNTKGDGSSACSALGYGSTGTKVDGAYSQKVGGYQFTVSGSGKQYLAFAPTGGTPTSTILAVIVKGGDAYDVYNYRGNPRTSDAGLTAPYNNGGNLPTISHYVVCYGPGAPVPPTFTKTLTHVFIMRGDDMIDDPAWSSGQPITIPNGETRWVQYRIDYSLPVGTTATITEDKVAVCATATPTVHCSFNTGGVYSWTVSGTGHILVDIDLINEGKCGDGSFINTAKLNIPGQAPILATAPSALKLTCGSITKTLAHVYIMVGSDMIDDPTWTPGEPVTIPHGETRWLSFNVNYVLPNGTTGTITENHDAVCATAGPGVWCGFNTNQVYSWPVTGTGKVQVDIDLINETACGDRTFTNTATLTLATGGTISATAPVRLKIICQ